jgi:hypothetical protein
MTANPFLDTTGPLFGRTAGGRFTFVFWRRRPALHPWRNLSRRHAESIQEPGVFAQDLLQREDRIVSSKLIL